MKRWYKELLMLCLGMILSLHSAYPAFAATDGEIKKISIKVTSSVTAGSGAGTVSATTDSTDYVVDSCDFLDGKNEWKPGDIPKVEIYLNAVDGNTFSKSIKTSKVSVKGAKIYTVKLLDEETSARVVVKLDAVEGTLGTITEAYWDSNTLGKAHWEEVENANAYELKLYRGNSTVHKIDKITSTSVNLYSYMNKKGSYTFRVRAIPRNEKEKDYLEGSDWVESEELDIDERQASHASTIGNNSSSTVTTNTSRGNNSGGPASQAIQGATGSPVASNEQFGWIQTSVGWWYKNPDNSYTRNNWQLIDGKWYFFDMGGYMVTGRQRIEGKEYYFNRNGEMVVGWVEDNRQWYLYSLTGEMMTGWVDLGGTWYYLNPDGTRASGWLQWKGLWYYLNPEDGRMMTNTIIDQRYLSPDGVWIS